MAAQPQHGWGSRAADGVAIWVTISNSNGHSNSTADLWAGGSGWREQPRTHNSAQRGCTPAFALPTEQCALCGCCSNAPALSCCFTPPQPPGRWTHLVPTDLQCRLLVNSELHGLQSAPMQQNTPPASGQYHVGASGTTPPIPCCRCRCHAAAAAAARYPTEFRARHAPQSPTGRCIAPNEHVANTVLYCIIICCDALQC